MVSSAASPPQQLPLLHVVPSDDIYLAEHAEITWYHVLRAIEWRPWRPVAALYYEALYLFNAEQLRQRAEREARRGETRPNPETQRQATLRLVFERPTEWGTGPLLAAPAPGPSATPHVDMSKLRPGVVPVRLAGRPPKCFFAMTKAFLGVLMRGRPATPENVRDELVGNPAFARACGFTLPRPHPGRRDAGSVSSDVPSRRKLEQFEQLMAANGLWDRLALHAVRENLASGRLVKGGTVVHDTTHFEAYSKRTAVEVEAEEEKVEEKAAKTKSKSKSKSKSKRKRKRKNRKAKAKAQVKKAEARRKAHPRTTKNCRCPERERCEHEWVSADPGVGVVTKTGGKKVWAHKASTLSFTGQLVPLDLVAMCDAASHDSKSVEPHLERLFERHPELRGTIGVLLDDGAADDAGLKARVRDSFEIEVVASQNTRGRKPITKDLPRGIEKITASGTPVCREGVPLEFVGCRRDSGHFVFRAPDIEDGHSVCDGCPLQKECCRRGASRRHVLIPFSRLPWIDPALPQISKSFARLMAGRTVIERIHKVMKYEYGDSRLRQRGTASVQAMLDKTLWAMHVVLARA